MTALIQHDVDERLGEDDMATRREEEFLAAALRSHQLQVAAKKRSAPGVCLNCDAGCSPLAIYCDALCREDHETRLRCGGR